MEKKYSTTHELVEDLVTIKKSLYFVKATDNKEQVVLRSMRLLLDTLMDLTDALTIN